MSAELLLEHLEYAAKSPDAVPLLQRFILDMAVRGKLVSQNPKDEPVTKLLERIAKEKRKLEKNGIIKQEKPLPSVDEKDIPFQIPGSWRWLKSGYLLNLQYGKTLPASMRKQSGKVAVYGSNGVVGYYHEPLTERPAIIIGRKGSAGSINLSLIPSWATDVAYYLIPPSCYDIYFLVHFLSAIKLETLSKGVKPGLNRNDFYQLSIPLPPLPEQKRIVAKVNKLMELCGKLEKGQNDREESRRRLVTAALHELKSPPQSFAKSARFIMSHFTDVTARPDSIKVLRKTILDMTVRGKLVPQNPKDEPAIKLLERIAKEKKKLEKGGIIKQEKPLPSVDKKDIPFQNPDGWAWAQLWQIGNVFNGNSINTTVKNEKYRNVGGGIPYIATKDVGYGWEELNYENGIAIPLGEPNFRIAQQGAVLICTEGGSAGKKCGLTRQDICFGNKLIATELYGNINPDYLLAVYQTTDFYELFAKAMKGIIAGVSILNFKSLIIPLPPLAEQKRIVAKVDKLMALCDKLESSLTATQENRRRLLVSLLRADSLDRKNGANG